MCPRWRSPESSTHHAAAMTSSRVRPSSSRSSDCHGSTSTESGNRRWIHRAEVVQNPQSPSNTSSTGPLSAQSRRIPIPATWNRRPWEEPAENRWVVPTSAIAAEVGLAPVVGLLAAGLGPRLLGSLRHGERGYRGDGTSDTPRWTVVDQLMRSVMSVPTRNTSNAITERLMKVMCHFQR